MQEKKVKWLREQNSSGDEEMDTSDEYEANEVLIHQNFIVEDAEVIKHIQAREEKREMTQESMQLRSSRIPRTTKQNFMKFQVRKLIFLIWLV